MFRPSLSTMKDIQASVQEYRSFFVFVVSFLPPVAVDNL